MTDGIYQPLAGFSTVLTANISPKTAYLPIDFIIYEQLLNQLADGNYSFLEIRDGNAIEIVKVSNVCGKIVLQRGAELTKPLAFRCGVGVAFIQTMQGVKDTICQMEDCDDL